MTMAGKKSATLFTAFLAALDVPHTQFYSDRRFATMPFNSLFGLTRLLREYGIDSRGLELADKQQITDLEVPFMAQKSDSFVVVTNLDSSIISYVDEEGIVHAIRPLGEFIGEWTGVVLQAFPAEDSSEPDYQVHRVTQTGRGIMRALWLPVAMALIVLAMALTGGWKSPAVVMGVVVNIAGLGVSYLLLQKQLGIKSHVAEKMCGAVQAGGCDDVLATDASKFFGLFGWSEVGATYFGVTLLALLMFPDYEPWVALFNVFCLPFSFWSVWYQRYRAHAWCTLCLTVQALLWIMMLTQLCAGWWNTLAIISWPTVVLGLTYLFGLLSLNRVMNFIKPL